MTTTNYGIDNDNGNLTVGLPAHTARRTAQRMADESGEPVYLYRMAVDGEDQEQIASEKIEPSAVEVTLDSPNGPLVEYGGHDETAVEAEIPDGYTVDWSNATEISISGTHTMRFRAPLVTDAAH